MPSTAKGAHVFRATQGGETTEPQPNAVAGGSGNRESIATEEAEDQAREGVSRDDGTDDNGTIGDIGTIGDNGTIDDNGTIAGWTDGEFHRPTSPPPSSVISGSKRKFSALRLSTPGSTPSASTSAVTSSSKRGRMTGAIALHQLKDSLVDFNSNYSSSIRQRTNWIEQRTANSAVERRQTAMKLAQEQEKDLDVDHLAALLELFEDASIADAYITLGSESLRKAWVRRKLNLSGLTYFEDIV